MTRSENLKRAQKNYEQRKKEADPVAYKAKRAEYMREYRRKKKEEKEDIKTKLFRIEELKNEINKIEASILRFTV